MKIGDECWVTVNSDGYITSGMLNCSLASAEVLREFDDGLVRVRIVPADPWRTDLENAPKDGTEFLGFCPWSQRPKIVAWSNSQQKWYAGAAYPVTITHWQPLDPSPEVE